MYRTIIGITADDLTGAGDTAAAFVRPGTSVGVSLDLRPPTAKDERHAFAVTTDTRGRALEEVFDLVADSASNLRMAGATLIYKKLDSNLRGNVGAELAAVLDTIGGPVLMAPAFPARRRTTKNATVLIDSIPVTETEMARDPEAPIQHANILRLLADQRPTLRVAHCPLATVRAGVEAICSQLQPDSVLIVDAETDADLAVVAESAFHAPGLRAVAGSAGLAGAMARRLFGAGVRREWPAARGGPVLAVLASSSQMLAVQVAQAKRDPKVAVVPFWCQKLTWSEQPVTLLKGCLAATTAALAEGRDAVLYAAGAMPQVERPVDLIVEHLARLALSAIREGGARALLVGGGATAQAVLGVLGTHAVEVDDEPLPGIAAGLAAGGEFGGQPVVLKPGAAGGESAVAELLNYLGRRLGTLEPAG